MPALTAKIALDKIEKIEIYVANCKKTVTQVKKATGANFIINGGMWNSDGSPCPLLKVKGKWLSKRPWKSYGFTWHNGSDIKMAIAGPVDEPSTNFITTTPLIINGKPVSKLSYDNAMGGKRPRTAMGLDSNGNLRLYATTIGVTPEYLRSYMENTFGCKDAIMLDGGGSTQCDFNGEVIKGEGRKCHNFICVYIKGAEKNPGPKDDDKEDGVEVMSSEYKIIQDYITKNPCYTKQIKCKKTKMMLHSTGTPGGTAQAFANNMNSSSATTSVEFVIDDTGIYQLLPLGIKSWHCGKSANSTHIACELCEPTEAKCIPVNWSVIKNGANNNKWAVTALQKELTAWGYDPKGIDGSYGPGCLTAVKKFQQDQGLNVDGCVGSNTLKRLQARNGSYLDFKTYVEDTRKFFEDEWNKAVWLFAKILKQVGGKASEITSHYEGGKAGIASKTHVDPSHIFPYYGKTMDDFRKAVDKAMSAESASATVVTTEPSSWAKSSWEKVTKAKIMDGTRPKDKITREEIACIICNLGLVKE